MDADRVEKILGEASRAVAELPEHLQAKAFELAVSMLSSQGQDPPTRLIGARETEVHPPGASLDGVPPDVSDVLRVCKRNPDRYLVFLRELELSGQPANTVAIVDLFKKFRQDVPKLPTRDLGDLVAGGLVEQEGRGRDASFVLKRKGRERLTQLDAGINAE